MLEPHILSLIAVDNVLKVLFGIDTKCYDVGRTECEVYTHLILEKEIFAFGGLSDIHNMMNFLVSIRAETGYPTPNEKVQEQNPGYSTGTFD